MTEERVIEERVIEERVIEERVIEEHTQLASSKTQTIISM